MDLNKNADKPLIDWLQWALSPVLCKEGAEATVYPMSLHDQKPCFAMTIDQRWLRGGDGTLTLFDSLAAVAHFLELININGFAHGELPSRTLPQNEECRCLQLGKDGLVACQDCRCGNALPVGGIEKLPAWQEEDWSRWDDDEW